MHCIEGNLDGHTVMVEGKEVIYSVLSTLYLYPSESDSVKLQILIMTRLECSGR